MGCLTIGYLTGGGGGGTHYPRNSLSSPQYVQKPSLVPPIICSEKGNPNAFLIMRIEKIKVYKFKM